MTATSVVTRHDAPEKQNGGSVVTPERFAQGMTSFEAWMGAIERNKEWFQRHYDAYTPDPDDAAAIKRFVDEHGVRALCLGEDWCPDVWRGLPVACKMADATGMELRIFLRDQNKDIMAEFLKDGEFESIPTIVLYDRDFRYLGHWIERADLANQEMPALRSIIQGTAPDTPERAKAMEEYREKTFEVSDSWRHAQVKEIRELLEAALA